MLTRSWRAWLASSIAAILIASCTTRSASRPALELGKEDAIGRDLVVERIAGRAFLVTQARPWPANALLVEMPDSTLVLVNTLYRPESANELLDWIQREFGHRPIVAINTHFHPDVLGGNAALLQRGVPVYGADLTVKALAERGERFRDLMLEWLEGDEAQRELYRRATLLPPDHVFPASAGLSLAFGGHEVQVIFPGAAHSVDNVVVFFPSERILFAGCLAIEGPRLGNLSDADVAAWPSAVRRIQTLDAGIVVPGHGRAAGPELLAHTLDVLAAQER